MYLVSIIPTGLLPEDDIYLHTINAAIFVIHCSFQPYKMRWLNVLDALLLADILFVSFVHLEYVATFTQRAVVYILILLPSLYLGVLILLVILKRTFNCVRDTKCRRRVKSSSEDTRERAPTVPSHTSVTIQEDADPSARSFEGSGFFRDSGEREPLLADSGDCNGSSCSTTNNSSGEERNRAFTTTSLKLPSVLNHSWNKASTS